ncbi:MAG: response regulator transcription factor, partial [Mycobacteriales bacterium]
MTEPLRVLAVDDEPYLVDLISTALRYEGFEVATAGSGRAALEAARSFRPHLVVLDVMLPEVDGFEVARRLAEQGPRTPVLFLTARDSTADKLHGFTVGGDDYVTKPFSLEELVARIRAILRRAGHLAQGGTRLSFADLEMDDDSREVSRAGQPIELTATEYRLLRYLLTNARRVLTRAQILDHVWEYDFGGEAGVLETYI